MAKRIVIPKVKRGLLWKILNLWYLPVFIPSPFFTPFGFLYTGIAGKKPKWIKYFVVNLVVMVSSFVLFGMNGFNPWMLALFIANWLFSVVLLIKDADEFLYRLDLSREEQQIFMNAKGRLDEKALQNNQLALDFIHNLHKWHREIESFSMKKNINDLIEISSLVARKDSKESERFFLRYNQSLNSLLQQYDSIENTKINSEEMKKTMDSIEGGFDQITEAFKKEAELMYKNDMLSLNAETAAFLQDLRNRGLLEDK